MATLYTPAAKTQGLDWLAGLVQNSQQLWQQERRIGQEAQRIQMARKQQEIQVQQFWASQAKLADQQEFQDRKFLYEVADDTRKFEWGKTTSDRNFGLQQSQEARLSEGQAWDMDPQNPSNQYRAAATLSTQVGTAQNLQEMADDAAPAQWGLPDLPGEDGTTGGTNASLFQPTGNPYAPGTFTTPSGQQAELVATSIDKKGRPTSFSPRIVQPAEGESWDEQRNVESDNLGSLRRSLRNLPPPPDPNPATGQVDPARATAYAQQVRAVEEANTVINQEIRTTQQRLAIGDGREFMRKNPLPDIPVSQEFKNVAPLVAGAYTSGDPVALESLRGQIEPLAAAGDAGAKKVLDYMNKMRGGEPKKEGPRTGAGYWNAP